MWEKGNTRLAGPPESYVVVPAPACMPLSFKGLRACRQASGAACEAFARADTGTLACKNDRNTCRPCGAAGLAGVIHGARSALRSLARGCRAVRTSQAGTPSSLGRPVVACSRRSQGQRSHPASNQAAPHPKGAQVVRPHLEISRPPAIAGLLRAALLWRPGIPLCRLLCRQEGRAVGAPRRTSAFNQHCSSSHGGPGHCREDILQLKVTR